MKQKNIQIRKWEVDADLGWLVCFDNIDVNW